MSWANGTFTGTGDSATITARWNADIESKGVGIDLDFDTGSGVGTVQIQRKRPSPYAGDFIPVGDDYTATAQQIASEVIQETEYKLVCTALSAGSIDWIIGHSD